MIRQPGSTHVQHYALQDDPGVCKREDGSSIHSTLAGEDRWSDKKKKINSG